MDKESIISDLKKYAGGGWINTAQKITAENINMSAPVEVTATRGRPRKAPMEVKLAERRAPVPTIEDVAALITPPYSVILIDGKISHDGTTIHVKCGRGHVHQNYVNDVIAGNMTCQTCQYKAKFPLTVRETLEAIFDAPFTASLDEGEPCICVFTNANCCVMAKCLKAGNVRPSETVNDQLVINLPYTTSPKKIKLYILTELIAHKYRFSAALQDQIDRAMNINLPKKFTKGPIPHTNATAEAVLLAHRPTNALLVKMNMNIVDNKSLCIEDCLSKN